MFNPINTALLILELASSAFAAEAPGDANAAAPAPSTPASTAPAAPASDATKIAFGIITLSADRHSLTMVDAKGVALKLAITDKTAVTIDLKKAEVTSLATDKALRVTYTGAIADAIDQLTPEKKKKKKKAP